MCKDIIGQEIRAGVWIAYAVRRGNSGEMKVGLVVEVIPNGENWRKEPNFRIKVRGYEHGSSDGSLRPQKMSMLDFPDKCAVMDSNAIPESMLKNE